MTTTAAHTVTITAHGETFEQTTKREVTHAVASKNRHGEVTVTLTRVPDKAAKEAARYGDTDIVVLAIMNGEAK